MSRVLGPRDPPSASGGGGAWRRSRRLAGVVVLLAVGAEAQDTPREAVPPRLGTEGLARSLDGERRARLEEALQSGAHEQAEALLVEAIERAPDSPDLLRLLGGVFFVQGRYLNAAVALKKAEALSPLDARSRLTLVMSYVVLGRRDWARPELERLARDDPKSPLYPYWTARLDYDDRRYAEAVKGFLHAVALDPGFMKAHDNLGLCYEALGRYDDAVRSHEEAIRLNRELQPPSPWPALNLGILLTRLDRLDEALALFRESLRADPRFPQAHYQLGVTLEKKGRSAEAVPPLVEAARLDPDYPEPHYALARIHRRNGAVARADEALATFQRLRKEKEGKDEGPSGPRAR